MLAALLVGAALALAPTPDRAAGEVASTGPVASSDPLSRLQQNLADLEERTASARAELLAHQAQQGGAAEHGPAAVHGMHGASRGLSGSHTIFKMPDAFDLRFTISTIFVLVIVTISFEKASKAPPTTNPYANPVPRPPLPPPSPTPPSFRTTGLGAPGGVGSPRQPRGAHQEGAARENVQGAHHPRLCRLLGHHPAAGRHIITPPQPTKPTCIGHRAAHILALSFGARAAQESVASEYCTTVLTQAQLLTLNHEQHVNYEFSHILMFTTAIVYAKEIFFVSAMLDSVIKRFEAYEKSPPQELLDEQVRRFGQRTSDGGQGPELNIPVGRCARAYEVTCEPLPLTL